MREQVEKSFVRPIDLQGPVLPQVERSTVESNSQPVLFVLSEGNLRFVVVDHHSLREMLPQMETAEALGIGHGLNLQDPAAVAAAIGEFLTAHPMR